MRKVKGALKVTSDFLQKLHQKGLPKLHILTVTVFPNHKVENSIHYGQSDLYFITGPPLVTPLQNFFINNLVW